MVRVPSSSNSQVRLSPQSPEATTVAAFTLRPGRMENTSVTVNRNAKIFDLHLYIGHLQKDSINF